MPYRDSIELSVALSPGQSQLAIFQNWEWPGDKAKLSGLTSYVLYSPQFDEVIDFRNGGASKHLGQIADTVYEWEGSVAGYEGRGDPQALPQGCATAGTTLSITDETNHSRKQKLTVTEGYVSLDYNNYR